MQESRALLSMDLRLPIIIPTSIITCPLTCVTSAAHHHHHQDQCPGILRRRELVTVGRRNFGLSIVAAPPLHRFAKVVQLDLVGIFVFEVCDLYDYLAESKKLLHMAFIERVGGWIT